MDKITFLGVEGAGKSVLTAALVSAFRKLKEKGWRLRPDSREAYRFLMEQVPKFEKGELPGQTASFRKLEWTITFQGEEVRKLDVLDYPGEIYRLAFLDAKDDSDPASFRERVAAHKDEIDEFLAHLVGSDTFFVLFNLDDALDQEENPRNLDAVWVTNACLRYLRRLEGGPSVSFLLTQADRFGDWPYMGDDGEDQVSFLLTQADRFEGKAASAGRETLERFLPLIADNYPDLPVDTVSALQTGSPENGIAPILEKLLGPHFDQPEFFDQYARQLEAAMVEETDNRAEIRGLVEKLGKCFESSFCIGEKRQALESLVSDAEAICTGLEAMPCDFRTWKDSFTPKTEAGRKGAEAKIRLKDSDPDWGAGAIIFVIGIIIIVFIILVSAQS